jgi:hypothetical protein
MLNVIPLSDVKHVIVVLGVIMLSVVNAGCPKAEFSRTVSSHSVMLR